MFVSSFYNKKTGRTWLKIVEGYRMHNPGQKSHPFRF